MPDTPAELLGLTPPVLGDAFYHATELPAVAKLHAAIDAALADIPPLPEMPTASDYLAASRFNDRRRTDRFWQFVRKTMSVLAFNRCRLGIAAADDPAGVDHDDRLMDWFFAFLTHATWAAGAHLPGQELPGLNRPTLDLAACEMSMTVSEMREVLLPWMSRISRTLPESIAWEVDRRVLGPFVERTSDHWWAVSERVHNNWTGVCGGAVLAAACSMEAQGFNHNQAKLKAIDLLNLYLDRAFTPHGECDEGLGYWIYGLSWACKGWMRLDAETFNRHVDLPRLKQVAEYPARCHLFGERFYAANDASPHLNAGIDSLWWLAEVTQSQWLAAWCRQHDVIGVNKAEVPWRGIWAAKRMAASDFGRGKLPAPPRVMHLPDQQAYAFGSGKADRPGLLVTFAGGHNAESHNHNDVGHVSLFVDGEPVLCDLGNMVYVSDFFGPRRYEYVVASSRGHNVPAVNGHFQRPGKHEAKVLHADLAARKVTIDLTPAYPPECGLRSLVRSVEVTNAVTVLDEVKAQGTVEEAYWCTVEPQVDAAAARVGPLRLTFEPAPARLAVEPFTAGELRLREYPAKAMLYRLSARYDVAGDLAVTVRIERVGA